jgi:hypothetical protein
MVPNPGTGGGGNIAAMVPPMLANRWLSAPAIAPALSSAEVRDSNGSSIANITAALGLATKPLIERPGNATTLSTPGWSSANCVILRTTASVRSSDAPFGSCAMPTR